ncbi:hypothetical protein DL96DRAFT_1609672 [Flagelloscypha sp. PMI_526]|nr:hypothetical protein DL96DRAFT_1609672 [Flagelloscypha sp. PMI_526]
MDSPPAFFTSCILDTSSSRKIHRSLVKPMKLFTQNTLWTPFERLSNPSTTDVELALSLKVIIDHSNNIITCNGILCGMVYQQTYSPGPLNNASKVLVTVSLLIVTWNRLQYESRFMDDLRMRIQKTGPLVPTLRYLVPEVLLAVLLILEGFKAGGVVGATMVIAIFAALWLLGVNFST